MKSHVYWLFQELVLYRTRWYKKGDDDEGGDWRWRMTGG